MHEAPTNRRRGAALLVAPATCLVIAAAVVSAAIGCRPAPFRAQGTASGGTSLCLADAGTSEVASFVATVVSSADPVNINLRQVTGLLPAAASDVVIVSDTATCRRAAVAYRSYTAPQYTFPLVPVDVIQAGPQRFVVRDASYHNPKSEWLEYEVFDTSFTIVGGFVR